MVTQEWMDDYIYDIERRILQCRLPQEDMRIVERYKEYRQREVVGEINFVELLNLLMK